MTVRTASVLDLDVLEWGKDYRIWIQLCEDAAARPLRIPVMVARGRAAGPTVGVTAVVHGNELNGIPIIHRLLRKDIDVAKLRGTVVGVPVVNLPGYLQSRREFNNGLDLNRIMPGNRSGGTAHVYAHRFVTRIVSKFDYLIDLHTASFGRVNAFYIRADMSRPKVATMARLISPQVIIHNEGTDGTLRSAADDLGIPAVTLEVGDPQRFQRGLIRSSRLGIQTLLAHLGMDESPGKEPVDEPLQDSIECTRSYWLYTDAGGVLQVFADVGERIEKAARIALLTDLFGEVIREYHAPEKAVVVGKNTNPVAQTGARIVHLGIEGTVAPMTRQSNRISGSAA